MRRVRRLLQVLVVVVVLLAGTAVAAIIVSQTAWFKNRVRVYVIAQAGKYLNGNIEIDRLSGNLYSGFELEGIKVWLEGQLVVSVKDIGLRYNLYQLATSNMTIDELRVNEPIVRVEQDGEGWTIAQLIKKQENEADRRGPRSPIRIDQIGISNGSIFVGAGADQPELRVPKRIERIDAKLSFEYEPVHYSIAVDHLSFRASEPELALNSFSGEMAIRGDTLFLQSVAIRTAETSLAVDGAIERYLSQPTLKLRITSDKTSVSEAANLVPALAGIDLQPAFELALSGPLDRLGIEMNVRSSAGQMTGALTADLAAPRYAASGSLAVQHLNLAPFVNDPKQASDISGNAVVDVHAESLSSADSLVGLLKIDAPNVKAAGYVARDVSGVATINGRKVDLTARARSYGATVTANGRVVLPEGRQPVAFDLGGRARHLNLQSLPRALDLPPVRTDVNAEYHVAGAATLSGPARSRKPAVTLTAVLADSTVGSATIDGGSTVNVEMGSGDLVYGANAHVRNVDLQELGTSFGVKALAEDRYRSRIDGRVELNGRGTDIKTLKATATGNIANASLLDGELSNVDFETSIANNAAQIKASGTFAGLDPSRLSGEERLAGDLGGRFDIAATAGDVASGVTLEGVSGTGTLSLDRATVGGLSFERGSVDAEYRDNTAEIRQLEIVGPDANLTAHGTLALGETGNSHLTVHADSPRLAEIGKLFDVPVGGIGSVDGVVSGNRAELQMSGSLTADGLAYEENGALTLASTYTATVRELDFAHPSIDAEPRATFVKVAGQEINELSGTVKYAVSQLNFDLTARQPQRSAHGAGSALLHPDHQEVHLEGVTLTTANQEWVLAPGEQATINYAHDSVTLDRVHLVSGDQEIVADGRLGRAGSSIKVNVKNVDLARVDELLLRPPQFTGRLNADATIEGTREQPIVTGAFHVAPGGFRQFTYDSLGGTVRYEGSGATIDARLQQNAAQWITAKGYVPATLFSAKKPADGSTPASGHVEPEAAADRIDLAIDSSPLGLGIIQGFTTEVTNIAGTVEAHLRVSGSADDPHPIGAVTLSDGGFAVASTGVLYSNINGRVDLQPDRVHIDQITVLDNHDSSLTVTGDLAVHAREVGDFQLWINAEDFKVVDNRLGNLRVNGALELGGELRSPELRGDFGVSTGRLDLDEILAQIPSAYSTEAIASLDSTEPAAAATKSRSILDGLRMNVRVTVPDDLLVNSSGIQVPGSLIDLGALNLTLGGDLTATKDRLGSVRLRGAVNTIRGTYEFQGRRFDVLREGGLRFEGTEDFDPRLDLRTHRIIQGVDARVNILGTLKQPEIELSSTPPLEDADILALVVFNQPLNELGSAQQATLVERAQNLAAGAVVGTLSQSIAKALNLETFRFDVAPESGHGPALTVGQQVGPNLYVKVQQGVGDLSTTSLLVEYAFTNWLRLQTSVDQGASTQQSLFQRSQGTGADLIFLFSK